MSGVVTMQSKRLSLLTIACIGVCYVVFLMMKSVGGPAEVPLEPPARQAGTDHVAINLDMMERQQVGDASRLVCRDLLNAELLADAFVDRRADGSGLVACNGYVSEALLDDVQEYFLRRIVDVEVHLASAVPGDGYLDIKVLSSSAEAPNELEDTRYSVKSGSVGMVSRFKAPVGAAFALSGRGERWMLVNQNCIVDSEREIWVASIVATNNLVLKFINKQPVEGVLYGSVIGPGVFHSPQSLKFEVAQQGREWHAIAEVPVFHGVGEIRLSRKRTSGVVHKERIEVTQSLVDARRPIEVHVSLPAVRAFMANLMLESSSMAVAGGKLMLMTTDGMTEWKLPPGVMQQQANDIREGAALRAWYVAEGERRVYRSQRISGQAPVVLVEQEVLSRGDLQLTGDAGRVLVVAIEAGDERTPVCSVLLNGRDRGLLSLPAGTYELYCYLADGLRPEREVVNILPGKAVVVNVNEDRASNVLLTWPQADVVAVRASLYISNGDVWKIIDSHMFSGAAGGRWNVIIPRGKQALILREALSSGDLWVDRINCEQATVQLQWGRSTHWPRIKVCGTRANYIVGYFGSQSGVMSISGNVAMELRVLPGMYRLEVAGEVHMIKCEFGEISECHVDRAAGSDMQLRVNSGGVPIAFGIRDVSGSTRWGVSTADGDNLCVVPFGKEDIGMLLTMYSRGAGVAIEVDLQSRNGAILNLVEDMPVKRVARSLDGSCTATLVQFRGRWLWILVDSFALLQAAKGGIDVAWYANGVCCVRTEGIGFFEAVDGLVLIE